MQIIKRSLSIVVMLVLLASLVACAGPTDYRGAVNIVEATEVTSLIEKGALVLDARGEEAYQNGHLEGAVCLPPAALSLESQIPGLIASKEDVEKKLSEMGIANDSIVLVYDDKGGVYSSRIWWMLKLYGHADVRVINGGARALEKAALKMSAESPVLTPSDYHANALEDALYATLEDVKNAIDSEGKIKLIDVRSTAEYAEGHIPTATLYPHTENLYSDGSFKSKSTIELNYRDLGLTKEDAIILYCKTSFRATQTALLLSEAGFSNVKVYDGAWVEWQNQDMPPAEKEQEVKPSSQDGS